MRSIIIHLFASKISRNETVNLARFHQIHWADRGGKKQSFQGDTDS